MSSVQYGSARDIDAHPIDESSMQTRGHVKKTLANLQKMYRATQDDLANHLTFTSSLEMKKACHCYHLSDWTRYSQWQIRSQLLLCASSLFLLYAILLIHNNESRNLRCRVNSLAFTNL